MFACVDMLGCAFAFCVMLACAAFVARALSETLSYYLHYYVLFAAITWTLCIYGLQLS
jgi:hypothetical protein